MLIEKFQDHLLKTCNKVVDAALQKCIMKYSWDNLLQDNKLMMKKVSRPAAMLEWLPLFYLHDHLVHRGEEEGNSVEFCQTIYVDYLTIFVPPSQEDNLSALIQRFHVS